MRRFILLIVIAILLLIGQAVPITHQRQPTVKKLLSQTISQTSTNAEAEFGWLKAIVLGVKGVVKAVQIKDRL